MVQASLDLLKGAIKNEEIGTFTLLSGADFPIKPLTDIISTLDETLSSRIDYWHDEDPSWHCRYQRYFFNDVPGLVGRFLNAMSRRLARVLPKRKFYGDLKPFFGSQWWTLTRSGAQAVLGFTNENPSFSRYCRTLHIPDEMFFQTILLNVLGERQVQRAPLRYLNWADRRANPKVLNESDFQALMDSNALFARKFNRKRSSKLLSLLGENMAQSRE